MKENKTLKIFIMPQDFPCGEQSSCCGPIGQSEKEIQNLKSSIENELGCQVEVLNVKNDDDMRNHPRIVQLLHSFGPAALPIIALEDEVVSMGNATAEKALVAIKEKIKNENCGKGNKMLDNDNTGKAGKENMEDSRACCPSASVSGDCCSPDSGSSGKTVKMLVFLIIVVAAGVVLARSIMNKSNSTTDQKQQLFAAIQPDVKSDTSSPSNTAAKAEASATTKDSSESPTNPSVTTIVEVPVKAAPALWGPDLDSLASLNQVAADTDAVFILLAADDQQGNQTITKEIESAAKTIKSNGVRVSAFLLNKAAPDYAQLANQVSVPIVLAMVKGRGMSAVSGQITETKLLQAFVAASRPGGGCCPSGADASGCGPLRPQ